MLKNKSILLIIALLVVSCSNKSRIIEQFDSGSAKIQKQFVPDLSLNVFDVSLTDSANRWMLNGETTVLAAGEALIAFTDSLLGKGKYQNNFHRLPLPSLGDSNYAIVRVSVAHLREEPRHSAQLVDQNIMGNVLRLLKNRGGWYLVQTEYGYIGWMRRESFYRTDKKGIEKWNGMQKVRVTALFPIVYTHTNDKSQPVTDVVLNSLLQYQGKQNGWIKVSTPDGRTGYIRSSMVTTNITGNVSRDKLRWSIIKTAENMMGIPYLWGGNSSKGNDCSGFTQTVFRANGIRLLRDARQQATEGKEIIPDKNFSNVLPGDLLFFGSGDRITHVGISLGGAEFIHQSGDVHINSLDPRAANYSDYRRKSLKKITRIISTN